MRIMQGMNKSILTYSFEELEYLVLKMGQKKFRVKQLKQWLYLHGVSSYDEMLNLPGVLRERLTQEAPFTAPQIIDKQISSDGTRKYVIQYDDGALVETVGMPTYRDENQVNLSQLSVCFSTQAGCAMECAFCATGEEGFSRNLSAGEMIWQVLLVQKDFDARVSHIVSMGQGEPFQNYDATLEALRFFNAKDGFGIGARHITISTCGILPGIKRLAQESEQFTLAVSLHSAIQHKRDSLMPRCKNMPLSALKNELLNYIDQTNRRVSFEYLLIEGINDTAADLDALKSFCDGMLCHINLIPINSVAHSPYQPSSLSTQKLWVKELKTIGKEATIRYSRGADIDGACGQLKNKLRS